MGDEFQSGICGGGSTGNWWNNPVISKSVFGSSPCSSLILNPDHNMGIRGYNSGRNDHESCSIADESIIFRDIEKPPEEHMIVSGGGGGGGAAGGDVSIDSTLQMMCIGLSSTTNTDWDQESNLLNGKVEGNYHHRLMQEEIDSSNMNFGQETDDWGTPKSFIATNTPQDSSIKSFNQLGFSIASADECNTQGLATNSYGYPSTMFDADSSQLSQSQFDNSLVNYSTSNYKTKLNEFSPTFPKFSSFLKSSLQQKPQSDHFPNFYNMASGAQNDSRANFFPIIQSQFQSSSFERKSNSSNLTRKTTNEEVGDSGSLIKKSCSNTNEQAFKRPRIQAPSPLPTFKVRKEKLGDRITALQQLVSPFGKTDTASVLHEAIEYIKLLHDQVHVLSTPYLKNGSQLQHQQTDDKLNDNSSEETKMDLKTRGLCLVPISSTFPVAADTNTTPDFWGPTFGTTFR